MNIKEWKKIPDLQEILDYSPEIECILFDMDGTLFNTEPLHHRAFSNLLYQTMPKSSERLKPVIEFNYTGFTDIQVWKHLKEHLEDFPLELELFLEQKNKSFLEILEQTGPSIMETKILSLLQAIKKRNITQALVTSSERPSTERILELTKINDFFKHITTRDCVSEHKPHPKPYIQTLELLKVSPEKALIIEDSELGIESARASGVKKLIRANWF